MNTSYVLALSEPSALLENVGGKGLSLTKMIRAGFPIPDGFHITTDAYRAFINQNDLQEKILAVIQTVDANLPMTLETASQAIQKLFVQSEIPNEVSEAIQMSYEMLAQSMSDGGKSVPVAIRSSATAEDLPEASFAGQQETYLNIHGIDGVLRAVQKCWASLWTARAIAYRMNHQVDQNTVALAIVVQEMVNAEAAGIVFTVNPMNGNRDEIVINAAWGLGEAIVGGTVTPDTIIVEKSTAKTKKLDVAVKTVATVAKTSGTQEEPITDMRRKSRVLKEAQVLELVSIAKRIESFFGKPQDIEWCQANGQFYILQSRPITTLQEPKMPTPINWKLPKGTYAAMRNNIVELMAEPLTPLFATLGLAAINASLHRLLNKSFAMQGIMPDEIIVVVNHYAYNNGSVSAKGMARMIFGAGKILKMMFTGALERWTEAGRPRYIQTVETWQAKNWQSFSSLELVDNVEELTRAAIEAYGALISGVIPAAWISEAIFSTVYNRLIKKRNDPSAATYLLGYNSIPIRSDKSLYSLAEFTREYPLLVQYLNETPTAELVTVLNEKDHGPSNVPPTIWRMWKEHLYEHQQKFGHTLYDLDFAHPVPADDPAPVLDAFKFYLRGEGVNPFTRQQESENRRKQAEQAMMQRLKGKRLELFKKYLCSAQKYAPLREDGLAEIGLAYPLIRQMLRSLGDRFREHQVISSRDDIFWLTHKEVLQIAKNLDGGQPPRCFAEEILQRKAENQAAQGFNPPIALPQMKIFGFDLMSLKAKGGRGNKRNRIKGVAASPGIATGTACVLHGPEDFSRMKAGDVLVAPITTPAWTPLFALASAIVTDVGGPLSHGSIVAREYGIPAVLGTGIATRRIHTGQTITVDGREGVVFLPAENQ